MMELLPGLETKTCEVAASTTMRPKLVTPRLVGPAAAAGRLLALPAAMASGPTRGIARRIVRPRFMLPPVPADSDMDGSTVRNGGRPPPLRKTLQVNSARSGSQL